MLRRCLLDPIPEFALAADHLSAAADYLIAGDLSASEQHLRVADLRALREFSYRVCGPICFEIHRQTSYPKYQKMEVRKGSRMPGKATEREVFARDG
jgi:hypothetical protein